MTVPLPLSDGGPGEDPVSLRLIQRNAKKSLQACQFRNVAVHCCQTQRRANKMYYC